MTLAGLVEEHRGVMARLVNTVKDEMDMVYRVDRDDGDGTQLEDYLDALEHALEDRRQVLTALHGRVKRFQRQRSAQGAT